MTWERTGTLSVTNGSTTVSGTGTQFRLNAQYGDNLIIEGTSNEIEGINSDTSITLVVPYTGATATGITDWAIMQTQSRTKDMNDAVADLVASTTTLADSISIVGSTATFSGNVVGNVTLLSNPTSALQAATKQYADTKLSLSGGTLTGALTLSGAPTADLHASTKKYVDDGLALKLDLTGGNVTGNLGVGATPGAKLHVKSSTELFRLETTAARGSGNGFVSFYDPTGRKGYFGYGGATDELFLANEMNGSILFITNSAERMRLNASGNLGVGLSNPGYKLDVGADARVMGNLYVQPSTTTANALTRYINTGGTAYVGLDNSAGGLGGTYSLNLWHSGAYPIVFGTNGVEKMRLTTSGYLGIGLTSPGSKLHVNSDTGIETFAAAGNPVGQTRIGVAADGTSQIRAYASMPLVFAHDNLGGAVVERMRIITNGNVGIGTTNPATKLEVSNGGQEGLQFFPGWAASACLFQARNTTTSTNINLYQNALAYYWLADGTERMRLSTSGNLSMTPPATGAVTTPLYIALGNDYTTTEVAENCKIFLYNTGGVDKYGIGVGASADMQFHAGGAGNTLGKYAWYSGNNKKMALDQSGNLHPGTDGTGQVGTSAKRWGVIFSSTGAINTSDAREKTWRGGLTESELAAGKEIISQLGFYQWNSAIEAKGEEARYHFGAKAQTVWDIMAQHGLVDPIDENGKPGETRYGFLCYDEWVDEDGETQDRYGLRPDELTLFLLAVQAQRIAAIEATIH